MSAVNVLTPNGRRQNVKVTPNTSLLQVLEEVCRKHGFKPEDYDIKHHNKILDVSVVFRFSGLPNNAQLEMAEATKQRQESPVVLVLQLESGERLNGEFTPLDSIWKVIKTLKPDEPETGGNPVVIYMRKEVIGKESLEATTLRSLGLTGGRAMLRFIHKAPEVLKTQLFVYSGSTSVAKKEESVQVNTSPKHRQQSPDPQFTRAEKIKKQEEKSGIDGKVEIKSEPHDSPEIKPVPHATLKITSKSHNDRQIKSEPQGSLKIKSEPLDSLEIKLEPIDGVEDTSKPTPGNNVQKGEQQTLRGAISKNAQEFKQSSLENGDLALGQTNIKDNLKSEEDSKECKSSSVVESNIENENMKGADNLKNGNATVDKCPKNEISLKDKNLADGEDNSQKKEANSNSESKTKENIILLGERNAVAFHLNDMKPVALNDVPDEFFELTIADAKCLWKQAQQLCAELEDAPLMTSAQKELEENKKKLMLLNQHKKTVIRIKFPDRTVLQGIFSPLEKVAAVEKFVAGYLEDPSLSFYLYSTPPKFILKPEARLIEVNCVPTAVLYFCAESKVPKPEKYLKSEVFEKFSTFSAASLAAHQARGMKSQQKTNEEKEFERSLQSSTKSGEAQPQPGSSADSDFKTQRAVDHKSPPQKIPKWFKPK